MQSTRVLCGKYSGTLRRVLRRPPHGDASLRADAEDGVLAGHLAALEPDGEQRDAANQDEGRQEEPPMDGRLVGEVLQVVVHGIPGHGGGHHETDEQDAPVLQAEHADNLPRRGPHDLAQPYLLAAVVALEERHAEHAAQGNQHGQSAEEQ